MPRTTYQQYLQNRQWLQQCLRRDPRLQGLGAIAQAQVVPYYRPHELLDSQSLSAHRVAVSKQQPSLPQCAGRALHRLQRAVAADKADARTRRGRQQRRAVVVCSVRRAEPDVELLARALVKLARPDRPL